MSKFIVLGVALATLIAGGAAAFKLTHGPALAAQPVDPAILHGFLQREVATRWRCPKIGGQAAYEGRGAADCGQRSEAAGVAARVPVPMSAFGGKADMDRTRGNVR